MPKVFRPKISNSLGKNTPTELKASKSPMASPLIDGNIGPPKPSISMAVSPIEPIPDLVTDTNTYTRKYVETSPPVDMDLFETKPLSVPVSQPSVELFASKSRQRNPVKSFSEPLPALDKPLDRTATSLRSLLRWNPVNKPPPSYRQNRLLIGENKSQTSDIPKQESAGDGVKPPVSFSSADDSQLDTLAPQLRLDADGNIILDESSLVVSVQGTSRDANVKHVNEESGVLSVTYNSFRRPADHRGGAWKPGETLRFYRALSTIGLDFCLMEKLFPNRSRLNLKSKFKCESRRNPYLVNQALRNRRSFDLSALVPLSDDENDAGDQLIDIKTKKTRPKPGRRKRTEDPRDSVEIARTGKRGTSHDPTNVNETIDAVLAQFESEAQSPDQAPHLHQVSYDTHSHPNYVITDLNPSIPSDLALPEQTTLLQRMINHKRAQCEAVEDPSEDFDSHKAFSHSRSINESFTIENESAAFHICSELDCEHTISKSMPT